MIGKVTKFKCSLESKSLQCAYDVIRLTESHEAGEIINNDWLIVNCDFEGFNGKYDVGYYVKVIDIRFCDVIETDINYDKRNDLEKININTVFISDEIKFKVNVYKVH